MTNEMDKILLAKSSTFMFTKTFFKSPGDPNVDNTDLTKGSSWNPYDPQILLYNLLDFGYDIVHSIQKPTTPAEIIVMLWPRQYGKTEACSSAAAALALRFPNSHIGIVSATEDSAKDFIDRIAWFINNSPFQNTIKRQKVDRLELTNNSRISSFPNSEKAIKGKSLTWLFIDEAAMIEDEMIDGACFPTVRTAGAFRKWRTPSIVLLSTPRGPKGRFYDYFIRGLEKREIGCKSCGLRRPISEFDRVRFDPRTMPQLPPCPKCGKSGFEYIPNEVITVTLDPWHHPTRTVEEIEAELMVRGDTPLARQELLGEIISDNAGVFAREWLESCVDENLRNIKRPNGDFRYVMAVDFGKMHDATVFAIGHMQDNVIYFDYLKHMAAQGGMEYTDIRRELLYLVDQYRPYILVLDGTGIGNPIVEQISYDIRDLQTIGIVGRYKQNGTVVTYEIEQNPAVYTAIYSNKKNQLGFIFDYNSKIDLVTNLTNLFQRRLIRIPGEYIHEHARILWKELLNFTYEYSNNNRIIYGTQREHDDCVIALGLLVWGCKETPWYNVSAKLAGEDLFVL
jgi:hypothetical protein